MKYLCMFLIITFCSCKKESNEKVPCVSRIPNSSKIQILENFTDTSLVSYDTVLANTPTLFKVDFPYIAKINSTRWDINNGSYTTRNQSFTLRFPDTGKYSIKLIVSFLSIDQCTYNQIFYDTIEKKMQVVPTDNNSKIAGSFTGYLDTKPSELFTIRIKYWRNPSYSYGNYYLRNYVNGCLGDNVDPAIPLGVGYKISNGYKNFSLTDNYPCNSSSNFRGFGYINSNGDSLIIKHFGYNTSIYVVGDTIPRWHIFKGKKI